MHGAAPPGAEILELGAGAGRITHGLLALGHPVVAVDQSPAMLALVEGATYLHAFDALLVTEDELAADLRAVGLERRRTLDPRGAWIEAVPIGA